LDEFLDAQNLSYAIAGIVYECGLISDDTGAATVPVILVGIFDNAWEESLLDDIRKLGIGSLSFLIIGSAEFGNTPRRRGAWRR
jgi:hypothetical protein